MMTTAALAFTLATASGSPVQVAGESRCPTASEVAALLPELLPPIETSPADVAWIESTGVDLRIELRDSAGGDVLFARQLTSSASCAELATIAAVVIASWTAERHPGISLLQPGVLAPAKPTVAPPPSPPAAPTNGPDQGLAPRDFDLSLGLGSAVNSAGFVGAARVDVGLRGRRLGLRAGLTAETARDADVQTGTLSWRRYGMAIGPTLAIVRQPVLLEARAEFFAGLTTVVGHGFDENRRSSAVAPGLAVALRLGAASGWIRPWIELGGQHWLASQEIAVEREQRPNLTVSLPRAEGRLFAGISVVLSR